MNLTKTIETRITMILITNISNIFRKILTKNKYVFLNTVHGRDCVRIQTLVRCTRTLHVGLSVCRSDIKYMYKIISAHNLLRGSATA